MNEHVARQISLARRFVAGEIDGDGFQDEWLAARRKQFDHEDWVPDDLQGPLDQIFMAIDDYDSDPGLRPDTYGLDEAGLRDRVTEYLRRIG